MKYKDIDTKELAIEIISLLNIYSVNPNNAIGALGAVVMSILETVDDKEFSMNTLELFTTYINANINKRAINESKDL